MVSSPIFSFEPKKKKKPWTREIKRNKRTVEKNNGLSGTKACVLDRDIKRAQLKNGEGDEEKK